MGATTCKSRFRPTVANLDLRVELYESCFSDIAALIFVAEINNSVKMKIR